MNTFLPEGAKEPKTKSAYTMPLAEGAHKLRVMSSAIIGYEGWSKEGDKNVPVRYKVGEEPRFGPDGKEPKYFWAFIVWNYDQERLQIMAITQKTIRTSFEAYVMNEAWGDPKTYDIVVTRKGMKLDDTEYTVVANPHSDTPAEVNQAYEESSIDLQAWREGEDPFKE